MMDRDIAPILARLIRMDPRPWASDTVPALSVRHAQLFSFMYLELTLLPVNPGKQK